MDDIQGHQELIDRYLAGAMSSNEKEEFETKLDVDAELKELMEDTELIRKGIEAVERERILDKVKNIGEELKSEESTVIQMESPASRSWLRVAAAITLVIVSSALVYYFSDRTGPFEVATYLPYSDISATASRGLTVNEQELLEDLWTLYGDGKYSECLQEIKGSNIPSSISNDVGYLEGLCFLSLGQYSNAIPSLEAAADSRSRYAEDAAWYLALVFTSMDRKDDAFSVLNTIKSSTKYPVAELLDYLK